MCSNFSGAVSLPRIPLCSYDHLGAAGRDNPQLLPPGPRGPPGGPWDPSSPGDLSGPWNFSGQGFGHSCPGRQPPSLHQASHRRDCNRFPLGFTNGQGDPDFFSHRSFRCFPCALRIIFSLYLEGQQPVLGRKRESFIAVFIQTGNNKSCVSP